MSLAPTQAQQGSVLSGGGDEDRAPGRSGIRRSGAALRVLPAALLLAVCVVLFRSGGGFAPTTWYAAALFCLAIAVATASSGFELGREDLPAIVATTALCGYTCWTFLSIWWAQVPADAWQAANLTLLYALAFAVAALWRIPAVSVEWIVLAYSVAIAVVGLAVLWAAARGNTDANGSVLLGGRLADPTSYPNATAAAFALVCWPALGLALDARMAIAGRAVALGTVVALAELNLLCQSRGSVFTLPAVAIGFLVLMPRRGVAAIVMAGVAVTVAVVAPTLLTVYDAESAVGRRDAIQSAFVVIVASATILGVAGLALPLLDRLPHAGRAMRSALRVVIATVVVAATAVVIVVMSPGAKLEAAWHDFRAGGVPSGSSHLSGLGSNRYDFYRVGLREFRAHPIGGIGGDNFGVPYLEQRTSDEQPIYPHSLAIRTLSQTGVVGTVLLTFFFAAAAFAVLRGRTPRTATLAGGLLIGVSAWLLHGFADWLWEMPALGLSAFVLLGVAVGVTRDEASPESRNARSGIPRPRLTAGLGVAFVVVAAASLGLPWIAARYEQQALSTWRSDTPASFTALDRAAAVNPLSSRPYTLAGAIHSRLGMLREMRESFELAVARNPVSWYDQLELAVASSALGDMDAALEAARAAYRLNPREPMTTRVLRGIEQGHPLRPAQVDRSFLAAPEP